MKIRVIVNSGGGTLKDDGETTGATIRRAFDKHGVDADVRLCTPDAVDGAFADAAAAPDLDAIAAAGGDGTVSSAAGVLAGGTRPLGIIPLGTLNHLARDAGIPIDVEAAVRVIAEGHARAIDVAEVNGRVFVNNSAVGLYPDMVRFRDQQQAQGRSKRLAMLAASLRALRTFKRRRLWIKTAEREAPIHTPLLFVGNNRYEVNLFALGRREALDGRELCLYGVRAKSRAHLFWAGIRGLFGKLDQQQDFVTLYLADAEISSDRTALTLSVDGETMTMATPLRYRVRPGALSLIVPSSPER